MPPLWDNQLVLDITFPSNGSLTPGSGTVYIGGPQLVNIPGLDVPQYKSAIVWFSDAVGLAQGIDYWFMAHFSDATFDGVRQGYYPTGGPTTISSIAQYIVSGGHNSIIESPQGTTFVKGRDLIEIETIGAAANVQLLATQDFIASANRDVVLGDLVNGRNTFLQAVNQMQLETTTSSIFMFSGSDIVDMRSHSNNSSEFAVIENLGTRPVIKGALSSTIDVWQNSTTTQTIGGLAGCTVKVAWRTTIDYVVEVRVLVTCPSPFIAPTNFVNCTLPNVFPFNLIDTNLTGQGPHLVGVNQSSTGVSTNLGCRIDPGSPAPLYFFIANVSPNAKTLEASGTFTIPKP